MGAVVGVTSEGETAKAPMVVCDPSYLPNKVQAIGTLLHSPLSLKTPSGSGFWNTLGTVSHLVMLDSSDGWREVVLGFWGLGAHLGQGDSRHLHHGPPHPQHQQRAVRANHPPAEAAGQEARHVSHHPENKG